MALEMKKNTQNTLTHKSARDDNCFWGIARFQSPMILVVLKNTKTVADHLCKMSWGDKTKKGLCCFFRQNCVWIFDCTTLFNYCNNPKIWLSNFTRKLSATKKVLTTILWYHESFFFFSNMGLLKKSLGNTGLWCIFKRPPQTTLNWSRKTPAINCCYFPFVMFV